MTPETFKLSVAITRFRIENAHGKGAIMKKLLIALLAFSASSSPAYAGQPVIIETDTSITVEYTGEPEDASATANQREVPSDAKSANQPASVANNTTARQSSEATSEEMEARRARRAERDAARAARRSNREPRGNGED